MRSSPLMHVARFASGKYPLYCGTIAAGVLIMPDLLQPSAYGAEGDQVLLRLCGVAIGVLVMFLAGPLAKRAPAAEQPVPAGQTG